MHLGQPSLEEFQADLFAPVRPTKIGTASPPPLIPEKLTEGALYMSVHIIPQNCCCWEGVINLTSGRSISEPDYRSSIALPFTKAIFSSIAHKTKLPPAFFKALFNNNLFLSYMFHQMVPWSNIHRNSTSDSLSQRFQSWRLLPHCPCHPHVC